MWRIRKKLELRLLNCRKSQSICFKRKCRSLILQNLKAIQKQKSTVNHTRQLVFGNMKIIISTVTNTIVLKIPYSQYQTLKRYSSRHSFIQVPIKNYTILLRQNFHRYKFLSLKQIKIILQKSIRMKLRNQEKFKIQQKKITFLKQKTLMFKSCLDKASIHLFKKRSMILYLVE